MRIATQAKGSLRFGFLLMGFSFTVTQALLIRELLVAFFGNELSIGLILGSWLILEAAGSGLIGRLAERWGAQAPSFATLQVLFALFLPLCLYAVFISRSLTGAIPGEGVGLVSIFSASFFILTPLALVDGAMFAFGCRAYARHTTPGAPAIGQVYFYEALGAIVGGVVFTYLFIPFLYSVQVCLLLSGLNLLSAALLMGSAGVSPRRRSRLAAARLLVLVLLAADAVLLLSPAGGAMQRWFTARQWAGHDLVFSENSPYGNVAVDRRASQYTFYADGIPILTATAPDRIFTEEIVHLPLLFVPRPQRALVLSGGVGGVLHELAKYPLTRVDYAELDPLLIEAVEEFPTPLTRGELNDPRVRVEYVDGRLLVRSKTLDRNRPADTYDLVVVNLPYPSTLQLNRFYTVEFFRMVRRLLSTEGVLVITSPGTLSYMSDELRHLNLMLHRTLQQAFPNVRPIPGDLTLWLASPSNRILTATPAVLAEEWERRGLEASLLTPAHIHHRLEQRYLDWFWTSLERGEHDREFVNRDLHPVGLLYGLSYWNALFSPALTELLAFAAGLELRTLVLAIAAATLLFLALRRFTSKGAGAVVPMVILTTGVAGMTADIVMIFAFQTLFGYVYHWIALLITAFMSGLSLGALLMTRRLGGIAREKSTLLRLELALVLFWALLPFALGIVYSDMTAPAALTVMKGGLLLLNAVAGFLVGSQFPLANRMWLKRRASPAGGSGVLYASDLIGAFLGAILVSVLLIPVLGIPDTCLLVAALKSGSLLLAATLPNT